MSVLTTVRRPAAALAAAATVLTLSVACSGGGGSANSVLPVGKLYSAGDRKAVGTVSGTLLSGRKTALSSYRGKVVVLAFWATWCGPCTVEIPQLDSYYRRSKAEGIDVLGVNTKNPGSSLAKTFVGDNKITFPSVYDPNGAILLKLSPVAARTLPATVLIDKRGRVAAVYQKITISDLQPAVDKLAAEKT